MKNILLVDDDPFISDIYSIQLKNEGYNVDVANNVSMALEKIINNYPDLLVLDLNLDVKNPGPGDGLNILNKIRQDQRTKNLKVIVMSNYSERDYPEISNLSSLGVAKIFLKVQSTPQEVSDTIKEILK